MIESSICLSYAREILAGLHSSLDEYKLALYTADAELGPTTEFYSPTAEVSAPGYDAGGQTLSGMDVQAEGNAAWLDWEDVVWPYCSIRARGALIYNASKDNRAVAVLDFGADKISGDGPFTVRLPESGPDSALIRFLIA
jgi:hypothetical protein